MSNRHPLALFNGSYLGQKPTGIGVVARELVNALDPETVPLLDPQKGSRPGSIFIPNNLSPDFGTKGHFRRLIWTQTKLPALIKRTGHPILLSPLPEAPLLSGVRSIVLVHDLLPLRYPQVTPLLLYHLSYVPVVLHTAKRILCNSEATAREVNGRLGVPISKLTTIPLGFNSDKLHPLDISRKPFFLVLGRHDPHKNIARVIQALSFLKDKEIELWMVGPQDDRYTPSLKQKAKELGLLKRCRWIPWVTDEEKLKLLNQCQALIIASLWEGFGLPALEAMACNTPVISARAGALPEVVEDAGLIVDPMNSYEIADAMKQVILDMSLRQELIANGRQRLNTYTWDKSAGIILEIINQLS